MIVRETERGPNRLFMQMADLLVSEGYAAAGYEYINGKS